MRVRNVTKPRCTQYFVVMCAFDVHVMFYHTMVAVQPERREATVFCDSMYGIFRITSVRARSFDWTLEANFWRRSRPQYVHVDAPCHETHMSVVFLTVGEQARPWS
jgi:hypothetical protein